MAKPSPPMLQDMGSVSIMQAAAARIPSKAFPPRLMMSRPAWAARGCAAQTMPRAPYVTVRRDG